MSVLIMLRAYSEQEALDVFAAAADRAYDKKSLSFALTMAEEISDEGRQAIAALGHFSFVQSQDDPYHSLYALYHGEENILMASEGMLFQKFWDLRLVKAFQMLNKPRAAITGFLPDMDDVHGAVCPVAVDHVADGMIHFHKGIPLFRAQRPQRCAFLNPWFCFAKPAFFECMAQKNDVPAYLRPFHSGFTLYTLHDPCVLTLFEQRIEPIKQPAMSEESPFRKTIASFVENYHLPDSPSATLGIYTPDLQFDMDISFSYKVRERIRQHRFSMSRHSPLFVAAYHDMTCDVPSVPAIYESRFRNLARLVNLPLALFIKSRMAFSVKRYFYNVYDYQRAYGLNVRMTEVNEYTRFLLSKFNLLLNSSALFPHHTHYVYINFGYVRFPIYSGMAINFDAIMDDKVHIARVNDFLDTTCFTVPKPLLTTLSALMASLVMQSVENNEKVDETVLFEKMLALRPELFTVHSAAEKRSLFLETMALRKELKI